jgi:prepilin-type N-terminal cleavage/methylation domain-containing protein
MGLIARARLPRRLRALAAAESGFTLVELIVAMVILTIVVASLSAVLVSATHSAVDANNRFQAQEQARTGLAQLTRELHCAGSPSSSIPSITDTSGVTLTPGGAYSGITAYLPATCATSGGQNLYVTWCTAPSTLNTSEWALYRVTSTSAPTTAAPLNCSSAGRVKWADYLQTSSPFCLPSTTVSCGNPPVYRPASSLPMLHVVMPVNLKGQSATVDSYDVIDDIALRNGTHS